MIDPEDLAAKNEQELNLFADQPRPGDAPAETGSDTDNAAEGHSAASPEITAETSFEPDDSTVVAPPPRRPPASVRPGVVPSARTPFPAAPVPVQETGHKPLPVPLQQNQTMGQMLTAIRSARGMSLEEVALATRIRREYLVQLEDDNLLKTLPHVYISAYVRKLIEVYDLSAADSELLIDKMNGGTAQDSEEIPEKLIKSVNEGTLVNEGENKRIRNITIVFFVAIGIVAAAILWLVILVIVHYARTQDPAPVPGNSTEIAETVQPAEEPVSQTIQLDESELDALIVPEMPSISVLKMSKVPGVRETP